MGSKTRKAVQYEIGNPLTATRMTRHRMAAALYAPLRVLRKGVFFPSIAWM
jgi:hypothetical protein